MKPSTTSFLLKRSSYKNKLKDGACWCSNAKATPHWRSPPILRLDRRQIFCCLHPHDKTVRVTLVTVTCQQISRRWPWLAAIPAVGYGAGRVTCSLVQLAWLCGLSCQFLVKHSTDIWKLYARMEQCCDFPTSDSSSVRFPTFSLHSTIKSSRWSCRHSSSCGTHEQKAR